MGYKKRELQKLARECIGPQLFFWHDSQTLMKTIHRFGWYTEHNPNLRKQNNIEHTFSLFTVARNILISLRPYVELDELLILDAVHNHDLGEGLLGRDVLFRHKNSFQDKDEFLAFEKSLEFLPEQIKRVHIRSFLLQFAAQKPAVFPQRAREIMSQLWKQKRPECLVFPAIESFEYLFYAFEGFILHDDEMLFAHVMRNQIKRQEQFNSQIPGWKQAVWTKHWIDFSQLALDALAHVPSEQK